MTPQEVLSEIKLIIRLSIETGLCNDQKYPILRKTGHDCFEIRIQNSPDLSTSMRNKDYNDIYGELEKGGAFNLRMIDGALIQMLYAFRNGKIFRHRLCVFPSPYLESYDGAQQEYEQDELYAEIVGRNIIRFPLRFDFCSDSAQWIECDHAMSHMTLGQYAGCRIPVSAPLTPARFMRFILRHFYNSAFERFRFGANSIAFSFPDTVSAQEREIGYLTI